VLNVTVLFGFPFADIHHAGMGLIVTTNNDLTLTQEKAKQIADHAWRIRKSFLADVVPVKEAVREAIAAEEGPVVLADYADNSGGGGPNDGTVILQELLLQKAKNVVVCSFNDPEAVAKAAEAGIGNTVTLKLGGKTDNRHGEPLEVSAYVKLIADGKFFRTGPFRTGTYTNLGRTAVLVVDDIEIITTTIRDQPTDLNHYRAFGVEPTLKKIIMVKSAVHFRAVHELISKKIIEVDAPGIHGTRFRALNYQKLRRPIFPLDPEMLGISELNTSLTADE